MTVPWICEEYLTGYILRTDRRSKRRRASPALSGWSAFRPPAEPRYSGRVPAWRRVHTVQTLSQAHASTKSSQGRRLQACRFQGLRCKHARLRRSLLDSLRRRSRSFVDGTWISTNSLSINDKCQVRRRNLLAGWLRGSVAERWCKLGRREQSRKNHKFWRTLKWKQSAPITPPSESLGGVKEVKSSDATHAQQIVAARPLYCLQWWVLAKSSARDLWI